MVTVTVLDDGDVEVSTLDSIEHGDFVPAEGFMRKVSAGTYTAHKSNLAASVAPGVSDDAAAGYSVGSIWIDTTADNAYTNVDSTNGVAVWVETSPSGAGSGDVTVTGTPADSQIAVWVSATSIEGDADFLWDQTTITIYRAVTDSPPVFLLGSVAAEQLKITPVYDGGGTTLDRVDFITSAASATADKGLFRFSVDDVAVLDIDDGGLTVAASGGLYFGAINILSDSSGTTTLNNVDALDATTIATFDAALTFGNVSNTGTPVDNQLAIWTAATVIEGDADLTWDAKTFSILRNVTDSGPDVTLGATGSESLVVKAVYASGTSSLESMDFTTFTASATAHRGKFRFFVDEAQVVEIDDDGIDIKASGTLSFNSVNILVDSGGTTTLSNIDAIDATTETTLEAALDFVDVSGTPVDSQIGIWTGPTTQEGTADFQNDGKFFVHRNPVNDGNPSFTVGKDLLDEAFFVVTFKSGTQQVESLAVGTRSTSATADDGKIEFHVDGSVAFTAVDGGIDITFNRGISIAGTDILTDASGTATLNNIDALDATTIATIDAAITTELSTDPSPVLAAELDAAANTIGFTAGAATGDGTTTIDWRNGNKFNFQFGAFNETFSFTAPTKPCNLMLKLVQDSVGSRTATWPATVKWPGGSAPTLTTTATTGTDIIGLYFDGTNYFSTASLDFS